MRATSSICQPYRERRGGPRKRSTRTPNDSSTGLNIDAIPARSLLLTMEKELDQKNIPDHFEELAAERHTNDVQLSGFEDLGAIATLKRFKYASLMCILVTFSAAADGYQVHIDDGIGLASFC
jgi:hypothetical protein